MKAIRVLVGGASVALLVAAGCGGEGQAPSETGAAGMPTHSGSGGTQGPAEAGQPGAGGTNSVPSEAGAAGASPSEPPAADCEQADDCPVIEAYPADCAEAECNEGSCHYLARDSDADGFRSKRCQSQTAGVSVERGDDCDDDLAYVSPNGWDGPAGDGFDNGCNDDIDQDCNGTVDDGVLADGTTCICSPGETRACSAFPNGEPITFPELDENGAPLGTCEQGSQECQLNGLYGPCTGAVAPAPETCDGGDRDCDGVPSLDDLDAIDRASFSCDEDSDGYLAPAAAKIDACSEPEQGCEDGSWRKDPGVGLFVDCNDANDEIYLGHVEQCDGKDNNCNLDVDEHAYDEQVWSYDGDGDSYRDATYAVVYQCDSPQAAPEGCTGTCPPDAWHGGGAPLPLGDCDDNNPAKNPSATDPCNGVDLDCDGSSLSGCSCTNNQTQPCGVHEGFDGKGICSAGTEKCTAGTWGGCIGSVAPEVEVCGVADRDCDGTPGNADLDAVDRATWACDADLDGHLAPNATTYVVCSPSVACAGTWVKDPNPGLFDDCDDSDGAIHPGAAERCNRLDDDCSSSAGQSTPAVVEAEDFDQDQHTRINYVCPGGGYPIDDCDDKNADVHPGQSTRFTEPYGCGDRHACYQSGSGLYKCMLLETCMLFPMVGPFDASFDYNCSGVEEKPKQQVLSCARINNQCTLSASFVDFENVACGQPATYRSCKVKPGGAPNQLPQCSLQDETLPLPCR